jgi:hypothetical protein
MRRSGDVLTGEISWTPRKQIKVAVLQKHETKPRATDANRGPDSTQAHALEPRRAHGARFHTRRRKSQSRKAISRTPPPIIAAIHSSGVIGFLTGTSIRFRAGDRAIISTHAYPYGHHVREMPEGPLHRNLARH